MKGKKLSALLFSLLICSNVMTTAYSAPINTSKSSHGPRLTKANEEKIIEMLKQKGIIKENSTEDEIFEILKQYVSTPAYKLTEEESLIKDKINKQISEVSKQNTEYSKGSMNIQGVNEASYSGKKKVAKPLVVLMDFPDYKNEDIKKENQAGLITEVDNYDATHYENMLFNPNGYTLKNGKTINSMASYYEAQSGGSYSLNGKATKWYTAKHPMAYYGKQLSETERDENPRDLVKEAFENVINDPSIDLSEFDVEDPKDIDKDGNLYESDGVIDRFFIIHAGPGQDAGGGIRETDAIWSHQWWLEDTYKLNKNGQTFGVYDYIMMPQDGGSPIFCHEYGHILGLADEYDTLYTGKGEPIGVWSLMAGGNWLGERPGMQAAGFSPYAKQFLQTRHGGNWQNPTVVDYSKIDDKGLEFVLDQASSKGSNHEVIKVTLPNKTTFITKPASGKYAYFGGKASNLNNTMSTSIDLSKNTSAKLKFKTFYDMEELWDYGVIEVKEANSNAWTPVKGNITTDKQPTKVGSDGRVNPGHAITGTSNDWVDAEFDLSAYAGKNIELRFRYITDPGTEGLGFYIDNISLEADNKVILSDNADDEKSTFTFNGFTKSDGNMYSEHYYLLEWRNHQGVDSSLAYLRRGNSFLSYDPGLLVWYVDNKYTDNFVGVHPGEGFIGLVDADQYPVCFQAPDGTIAPTSYSERQIHDAAFSLRKTAVTDITFPTFKVIDNNTFMHPFFDDSKDYSNQYTPHSGRNVPKLGLKFYVVGENKDRSQSTIRIIKSN